MRYLMLVLSTPDAPAEPGDVPRIEDWVRDTYDTGRAVLGDRLRPPADAVGVQVRAGEVIVTDGPFSETKEVVAGFDVLDAPDLDEAIRIAAAHPMAYTGALELRPFWPLGLDDGVPTEA
ncbi:YciI family protein [Promicromonospora sukumoe]|uniref:YciI family protein n=1 Tax=Promicromonospora sukumoe TaxID=88382 RepID=UPI00039A8115|nr:YciI family protein [Promicromonospora sukumoe]